MKKKYEKGEAIKKIFDQLEREPATPKQLQDKLGLGHSTVMNVLRGSIVARIGIFKKLPDDRYAVKWYFTEEDDVKSWHETLKKKLLRPPTLAEVAVLAKRKPEEVQDLLIKYIPGYREPTKEEIINAQKALWKTIIWGTLDLPSKKELFEKGIVKLIVDGTDQQTLDEVLDNRLSTDLDQSQSYITEFPEMRLQIIQKRQNNSMMCKLEWSDDAKKIFDEIDSWKQTAEVTIPRRYDNEELGGTDIVSGLDIQEKLSDLFLASEKILHALLDIANEPHGNLNVLPILKKYCQNALKVDQMDGKTKDSLVQGLVEAAFFGDHNNIAERNTAFEIIDMLEVRNDVIEIALDYLYNLLNETPDDFPYEKTNFIGPDIHKVAKWIAKDLTLKVELEEKIEDLLKKSDYPEQVSLYMEILRTINEK